MIISIAIAYMASLATWVLIFSALQAYYWMWVSAVVACIAACAAYELTEVYMTRRVWPITQLIARGTARLGSAAANTVIQSVRGLRAREEHTHV